jgi:putative flavoprotein involved in K+ transport
VLWCTGFSSDYGWIDLPAFDARGNPRHYRGASSDVPGLYFAGLRFQHRLTSSLLGGVGADAAMVAAQIATRVASSSEC